MDDFCLVQTVDGFGQGVVVAVAAAANRGFNGSLCKALGLTRSSGHVPDSRNLRHQHRIAFCASTAQTGITLPGRMAPVGRRGDLQHFADQLDPVGIPVLVDVGVQDFSLRSSSAWTKADDAHQLRGMGVSRYATRHAGQDP